MLRYLTAFVERLGPIGFGVAVSLAFFMMLGAMLGTKGEDGMPVAAALFAALFVGGFVFFATGTAVIIAHKVYAALLGGRPPQQHQPPARSQRRD